MPIRQRADCQYPPFTDTKKRLYPNKAAPYLLERLFPSGDHLNRQARSPFLIGRRAGLDPSLSFNFLFSQERFCSAGPGAEPLPHRAAGGFRYTLSLNSLFGQGRFTLRGQGRSPFLIGRRAGLDHPSPSILFAIKSASALWGQGRSPFLIGRRAGLDPLL